LSAAVDCLRHRLQAPLHQPEAALGPPRHFHVVGHQHHGHPGFPAQLVDELHQFGAGGGVQIPGRLVEQEDAGLVHQRPGDGHPLLLATGELQGAVLGTIGQPHLRQAGQGPLPARGAVQCRIVVKGQFHVAQGAHPVQQVKFLEHEPQCAAAEGGQGGIVEPAHVIAPDQHLAGIGLIETAEDMQQGRLSGARGSDDGDVVTVVNGQIHPAQRFDQLIAHAEALRHLTQLQRCNRATGPAHWRYTT
jgi:hypothetical protein